MKFKLAVFADEADCSLDGQISAMKENGVEHLEIRGVYGENISDITADKARDIRARLDAAGLSVWKHTLHSPEISRRGTDRRASSDSCAMLPRGNAKRSR